MVVGVVKKLKVLHLAYQLSESSAAYRIAKALEKHENIETFYFIGRKSKLIDVMRKTTGYPISVIYGVMSHVLSAVMVKLFKIRQEEIFSFYPMSFLINFTINWLIKSKKIDLIHVHWGGYGFFSTSSLDKIQCPIVFTSHDFGSFTGGCHLIRDCSNYVSGCNNCPLTDNEIAKKIIHNHRNQISNSIKKRRNIVKGIVSPSNYPISVISGVNVFDEHEVIPNCLGEAYTNIDALKLRGLYSKDSKYKIIVVGITDSCGDNKGAFTLYKIINHLCTIGINITLVMVGCKVNFEIPAIQYERKSSEELIDLYASSDLCLVPSKYETFSQVTLESLRCATPVLAFDNSGPKFIIEKYLPDFLVQFHNENEYIDLVTKLLDFKRNNFSQLLDISEELKRDFSDKIVAKRYSNFYKKLLRLENAKQRKSN